ncbi:MAG: redoxin domain-containing protein [Myxococcota bacterium]
MTTDASTLLSSVSERPLTVLVFFRGSWCPFCQSYLRELNGSFRERLEGQGGKLVGVTSQSADAATQAHDDWGLAFDVVSQPSNDLARRFEVAITEKAQTPLAEVPGEYPSGMAQPAVVALDRAGKVLYRWAIEPSTMNLGGATDRPLPDEIWAAIEAARAGAPVPAASPRRLDVDFIAEHYPEQHATFVEWTKQTS